MPCRFVFRDLIRKFLHFRCFPVYIPRVEFFARDLTAGMRLNPPQFDIEAAMQKIAYRVFSSLTALSLILVLGTACTRQASTDAQKALESRLQKLEDREEIGLLLKAYGRFLDQRDFEGFSQLFAQQDGEWIGGLGQAKGAQAIRGLMENSIGKSSGKDAPPNFHLFMNEMINVNGAQADSTTKWIFVVAGEKGRPQPLLLGHYDDTLIRENGRWKFLKRVVHADIPPDQALSK